MNQNELQNNSNQTEVNEQDNLKQDNLTDLETDNSEEIKGGLVTGGNSIRVRSMLSC